MTTDRDVERARQRARRAAARVKVLEAQRALLSEQDEELLQRWLGSADPKADPWLMYVGIYEFVCATCLWREEDVESPARCQAVFDAFRKWANDAGLDVPGRTQFYRAMWRRGFDRKRRLVTTPTGGVKYLWVFPDLELMPEVEWVPQGTLRLQALNAVAPPAGEAGQSGDDNVQSTT